MALFVVSDCIADAKFQSKILGVRGGFLSREIPRTHSSSKSRPKPTRNNPNRKGPRTRPSRAPQSNKKGNWAAGQLVALMHHAPRARATLVVTSERQFKCPKIGTVHRNHRKYTSLFKKCTRGEWRCAVRIGAVGLASLLPALPFNPRRATSDNNHLLVVHLHKR